MGYVKLKLESKQCKSFRVCGSVWIIGLSCIFFY